MGVALMSRRDLDAAGITDPALRASYEACRRLHADHGKTYYLATLLLPPYKRPHVNALYGFARYADEFVDSFTAPDPEELLRWGGRFLVDLERGDSEDPIARALIHTARTWGIPHAHFRDFLASMRMDITVTGYATYADLERGHSDDEIGRALIHTARTFEIPHAHFRDFLASMRMDITVTGYATYGDLEHYMYGSAAVIGLEMVPILGPLTDEAYPRARALGEAFQLSNFIRDVGEDLRRGRVYLPQEDLDRYEVTRADLARGVVTPAIRALLRFEISRARALYAVAQPGVALLDPTSRDCVQTAITLYGGILAEVERADYQVLTGRVRVPTARRARVALPALVRARRARTRRRVNSSPLPS